MVDNCNDFEACFVADFLLRVTRGFFVGCVGEELHSLLDPGAGSESG